MTPRDAIAFIGAGNIAETHAAIRQVARDTGSGARRQVDPVAPRAQSFARRWGVAHIHDSVEDADPGARACRGRACSGAPPPLASRGRRAGFLLRRHRTFCCTGKADGAGRRRMRGAAARFCRAPAARRSESITILIHHPAHVAARCDRRQPDRAGAPCPCAATTCRCASSARGSLTIGCSTAPAICCSSRRSIRCRRSTIWSDRRHAEIVAVVAAAPPLRSSARGRRSHRTWLVSLQVRARHRAASSGRWARLIRPGDRISSATTALIFVDYLNNRIARETSGRTMDLDLADRFRNGASMAIAFALKWQSLAEYGERVLRRDAQAAAALGRVFPLDEDEHRERSMTKLDPPRRDRDLANDGRRMVELCERIVAGGGSVRPARPWQFCRAARAQRRWRGGGHPSPSAAPASSAAAWWRASSRRGVRVRVLARGGEESAAALRRSARSRRHFRRRAQRADDIAARDRPSLRPVINLAHGGGGANWAEIEANLVGGAKTVAGCCIARGVRDGWFSCRRSLRFIWAIRKTPSPA